IGGTPMPLEGTVGGMALESGQPIFMNRPDPAVPFAEFDRRMLEAGIKSGGVVPLIAHDKKLGFLGIGSFREDAFPPADQELLCHIANQIAIAVENSLNFERAQQAEQESRRRFERERLMLEINNAVVANLALPALLAAISGCLRRVVPHDFAGLALYDETVGQLRVQALDYQRNQEIFGTNDLVPLQGTGSGKAFRSRQTFLWSEQLPAESPITVVQQVITAGFKSSCHVPLIVQDRALGTLDVMSAHPNAFTEADAALLTQVGQQIAIAVENALNFERAVKAEQDVQRQFERLRLMLDVNNATVTQLELRELVRVISDCLREALQLAIAGVSLYDAEADCLRAYFYDLPETMEPIPAGTMLPLEGSIAGHSFTTGQPVLLTRDEQWDAFPVSKKLFLQTGIKSGGCVPLIVQGRKLGVLGVDSYEPDAFPPERQQLLCQIADQLALAVDNALNYERARKAEQEVQRKLEREQLMLKITNAVVAHLDLQELLRVVSSSICETMDNDSVGVGLFDQASGQLRVFASDYPPGHPLSEQGIPLPLEGTPSGLAFTSGQPVFLDQPDFDRFPAALVRQVYEMGYRSGVSIPLIAQGRRLGVLGISSKRENAFSDEDKELICQVANQVAIAVDNALNFDRAVKAEQQVQRKLEREQLMLQINNALVTQLDLRELVRVVSSCLRETLHYDIVGLSLFHAETNQLRAYAYDFPGKQFAVPEGTPIPLDESMGGRAFTAGRSLFYNRPDPTRIVSTFNQRFVDIGVKSGGCVPLIAYGRKLGVLGVASFREDAFPPADQELLGLIANQIALAVKNALDYREIESLKNKLTEEKLYLEEEINTAYNFEEIIGSSPALRRILKQVETVAPTDSTVLIVGETGTGKELIARAIHNLSARHERTLVKLNCAAIPTGLLESELFGHERGAFTGAIAQRVGRFELAHKGSMFLDEVGEIPLELQPKLLRVLQEQEFERLGNARTQRVDVRLIAATNRDLAAMSTENRFRSDLYY
ncbi:MAG: GAF domain-containing protein, partial [Acidobacteria bacterium]|nr:GAF domain-containing protein [Acidobacteriota bacterium]